MTSRYRPLSYYRLSQTDFDGSTSQSGTVTVDATTATTDIVASPNPFLTSIDIRFRAGPAEDPRVFDVTGREVSATFRIDRRADGATLFRPHPSRGGIPAAVGRGYAENDQALTH